VEYHRQADWLWSGSGVLEALRAALKWVPAGRRRQQMIRGAIFDMDGVLVDNNRHHLAAWKALGREMDRDFSDADILRLFGQRNREILQALLGRVPSEKELLQYAPRKEALYREIMRPELVSVPGLADFLANLRANSVRTAVATSGPQENLEFVLEGLKVSDLFDVLVTGPEVPRSKPHPDIFVRAAERLGFPPAECVVFEDSAPGIQAALKAGCPCVALATTHSREELKKYGPSLIVADFRGLRIESINRLPLPRS